MKRLARFNTVYYKLVTSYAILIFVSIAALGLSSYWYFSKNFNEQIEKVNARMLHHLSDMIDRNVIRRTEQLYVDMVMDEPRNSDLMVLFQQPLEGNHSKLLEVNRYLSQLVTGNDDLVEAIEIYYRGANATVSSGSRGYMRLAQELGAKDSWIEQMLQASSNTLWLRQWSGGDGEDGETLTFVRAYPFTAAPDKAAGFISIRLKPDAVTRYLEPEGAGDKSSFLLLDDHGILMAESLADPRLTAAGKEELHERIQSRDGAEGNFLGNFGVETMASYTTLSESNWRLVNITPVDQYYRKSRAIRHAFLILCFTAVGIGVILSNIFTLRIYNPLDLLMRRIRSGFIGAIPASSDKAANELQTIDHVINHLSLKVTELEQTFADNLPLIKHHLVTGLMQRSIASPEELAEMLRLLDLSWSGAYYTAAVIELDAAQISLLSPENAHFIQYNLLKQIEGTSGDGLAILATALSHYRIGVILAADSGDFAPVQKLAAQVARYVRNNYMLTSVIAYGSWVLFPLDLHMSCEEAQAALGYHYFLPEAEVLSGPELMKREESRQALDEANITEFARLLKAGSCEGAQTFLRECLGRLAAGPYSAAHGHQRIRELVSEFRAYLRELHIPYKELFATDSWEDFRQIRHIRQMEEWLLSSMQTAFRFLEDKQKARGSEVIRELHLYVAGHYQSDLSLETAAEHVSLSPRYLSKVFKEETGINFTDYVTQVRLEKAVELIVSTDDTVEQISRQCGFNSSGYFIKKFKDQYGVTPKMYKSLQASPSSGQ